jgi:CheY-like chemotaxis protein
VLMDMQMPEMDGLEATIAIRQLPGKAGEIPIIGVTANAFREDHERCREAGMQDIVTKPFRWSDLAKRMTRYLPSTSRPAGADPLDSLEVANPAAYAKLVEDISEESAQAILEVFLRDARARLQRMIAHAESQDAKALAREAHALKGSVELLGFERLTFASSMLEIAVKEGSTPDEAAELIRSLQVEFATVEQRCLERLAKPQ